MQCNGLKKGRLAMLLALIMSMASISGCVSEKNTEAAEKTAASAFSVSSNSDLATDVAMEVLSEGGNAVDAAVALAYTLAVVEPYSNGIGGSGCMLVYDSHSGECVCYDYRAGAGAIYDAVSVPGFVAGTQAVYDDYATMPLADLMEPAIAYAEDGFEINAQMERRLEYAGDELAGYTYLRRDDGAFLKEGDVLVQKELADTLRQIQENGTEIFYFGEIAEDIAAASALTMEDLAEYTVNKSKAVKGSYEGYTIYGAGAPYSGTTVIQMLEMAEEMNMADPEKNMKAYLQELEEITEKAYHSRYESISDPAFYAVDEQELVSEGTILEMLGTEDEEGVEEAQSEEECVETTSFSVMDGDGLIVSCTNTLSSFWGNKAQTDGFFLNNTGDNFSGGVNEYEAGKRSRSFTAPVIVTGEDGFRMAVGTPGGNNIPGIMFQVLTSLLKYDLEPQDAVDRSRILYCSDAYYMEYGDCTAWYDEQDIAPVSGNAVWKKTGYWWGSVSVAGYDPEEGAFSAYDSRRGASHSGVYNAG